MNKRLYPITILVALLAVVAAAGYLAPAGEETQPVRVLLPNKGGKVVFEHLAHAETYGIECDACHHTGDYEIPCVECHNAEAAEEQGIPNRMEAFHMNCMGCHEEMGAGPYEKDQCNQCHLK